MISSQHSEPLMPEFLIGECRVNPGLGFIIRDNKEISVNPRTMSVLMVPIEERGRLVSGKELLDRVWPANHVGTNTVYRAINELREAFGDSAQVHEYIETKSRKGYRLIAQVEARARRHWMRPRKFSNEESCSESFPRARAAAPAISTRGELAQRGWR